MWRLVIAAFAASLLLSGCKSADKKKSRPFADVLNFDEEVLRLDSSGTELVKTVYYLESVESKHARKPNWDVELKPFIDADFNRAANRDRYSVVEDSSKLAGIHQITYQSKDDKSPAQWAVYRYKDNACILAAIDVRKKEQPYDLQEELIYLPKSGYKISNSQELQLVFEEQFDLRAAFSSAPQPWRLYFDIGSAIIPVNIELTQGEEPKISIVQSGEVIDLKSTRIESGYRIDIPVFNSYLTFSLGDEKMEGIFHNLDKGPEYTIPFTGSPVNISMFFPPEPSEKFDPISGKWECYFGEEKEPAIGIFERLGDDLYGSFATETGDYRYLQGKILGDSFYLTTFDGAHLFLFTGNIDGNTISNGQFYSGTHYHTTWIGKKNESFELRSPDELTFLKPGYDKVDFSFPNLKGEMVSLSDEKYRNKVVIVQILGSWCPNCMDETKYFSKLYRKYHEQGLEIIGLAFERPEKFEDAAPRIQKAINDLNVPYQILLAGTPKQSAEALPMLNHIMSYPTAITIDRNGKVVKIHTGFYGPGTGDYFKKYREEKENSIELLLGP